MTFVFGEQIGRDGETDSMDMILDEVKLWFFPAVWAKNRGARLEREISGVKLIKGELSIPDISSWWKSWDTTGESQGPRPYNIALLSKARSDAGSQTLSRPGQSRSVWRANRRNSVTSRRHAKNLRAPLLAASCNSHTLTLRRSTCILFYI